MNNVVQLYVPNKHEIELMLMIRGDVKWEPWGSWMGVAAEFLQEAGFLSDGPDPWELTEKGENYLKRFVDKK